MDTKIVVAIIGAAGAVSAAIASAIFKGRKGQSNTCDSQAVPLPASISVSGTMTDSVIGSTGVVIDRSQHNVTMAAPERRPASLNIVDASTSSYSRQGCAVIDVKVRNPSDEVIFLKRANLEVLEQWNILQPREP